MAQLDEIVNPDDIKNIKELTASFNALNKELEDLKNENKKVGQSHEEYSKMVNRAADVNNKLTMTAKELENQNKQLQTTNIKLSQVESKRNIELQKQKIALQEANKALRDKIKAENENAGSINRLKTMWSDFTTKLKAGEMGFKSSAQAVGALGKQLFLVFISNPVLLAITAIVGAVVGLYKAFQSTDSGATELAAKFERLKAIFDVLRQGFAGFANGIVAFFSGDKQKANEEFAASFKNIGERMKEAANAGEEYIKTLDTIEDSEANYISRSADLQNQIAKLEYTAQDRTKSTAERKAALEEALKLGQEEVNERKRIAEEKFNNEAKYLAAKNGITQQELISFIKMSDSEQLTASEGVKTARNNNEEKFKNLEELYANMINADTKYFEENKRNLSRMTGFQEQENKAREQAAQEAAQLEEARSELTIKAAEREYEMQLLLIKASGLSKEEQEAKTFELKKQYLLKSLDLLEKELNAVKGNELEKLKIQEKINAERAKLDSTTIEQRMAENEMFNKKQVSDLSSFDNLQVKAKETQEDREKAALVKTQQVSAQKQAIAETEVDKVKMSEDEKAAIIQASTEAIIQIQGAVFDFINNGYNDELTLLEQKNQQGLLSDKEYAKQKAEIEIKQAKLAKIQGVFETSINTAAAVVGMLKDPGGVAGTIMAVAAGITGGLQIASILSQPLPTIPAFAEGTKNAPSFGLAGEAGTELGITKTGESILFDKPTIFKGEKFKGMHIYSNPELEAMKAINQFNYTSDSTAIVQKLDSLEKAIQNKPVFIFDKEHNIVGKRIGNYTEKYVNRLKLGD